MSCISLSTLNFNSALCASFNTGEVHPFYDTNISTINIGSSVQKIPDGFASGFSHVRSVNIPNSVKSIGNHAFNGCIELTSITIPNSVTSIEYNAFKGCTTLNTLNFNADSCADFNSGSSHPFYNSNISMINIGNNVQRIPSYFANGLTGLTNITIPNSVKSIGQLAFQGCTALNTVYFNADSCADFNSNASNQPPFYNLNISTIYIGNSVRRIPSYFASGLTKLTDVIIGNSVTSIGAYSFDGCSGLTGINIPSSVTSIELLAFRSCRGLQKVNITDLASWCSIHFSDITANPLYSAHHLYLNGVEVTDLIIPSSFTTIGNYTFSGGSAFTSVTIPNTINSFGWNAFDGCSGLTKVNISDIAAWCNVYFTTSNANPLYYAHHLYLNGTEVTKLNIPNNVTLINYSAFYNCTELVSVTIPESVTTIRNQAFYGCTALDTLNFKAISCADFNSTASYRPFYNRNFSTIKIGDNVEKIPAYFAYGMTKLTSLNIPKSVSSIGHYSFNGCSGLTGTLTIPQNVTYIGNQAFNNVPSLEAVTCAAETPPSWDDLAIFTTNVYNHAPLYVPLGTERTYMADQSWGQFATIIGKGMNDDVLATSISLNQSQMSLQVGSTLQLTATVLPDSTTNKVVNWVSSDENVATVDTTGLMTAIAVGSATITATTTDGSNLNASCVVTVTEDLSNYDNYLSMNDTAAFHGETIVIPVKMTNETSIISFQTDIFLPEGLELLQEDGEYLIDPSERMTRTHSIMSNDVSNGAIRVICYSSNYKPFTGNSGDDLFYLTLKVADDAEGDYTILLKNTLLTNTDFVDIVAPDVAANVNVKSYLLGDANNSGTVTVTDVVVTAQYVLERNPQPFVFEAADVNFDNNITVADVSRIAWMVLNPTLNAPLRAPALWNNGDRMSGSDITLSAGETRRVSIMLDNEMDYSAFQFDLKLPSGLIASNFQLTDRAGSHAFDVNTLQNDNIRALCYSPDMTAINGHEGALLTFDVTATGYVKGDIIVDGIELITTACQSVRLDAFTISVNNPSGFNEVVAGKTVAKVEYFNLAGQQMEQPESGITLVVTTYTDGTRSTSKIIR